MSRPVLWIGGLTVGAALLAAAVLSQIPAAMLARQADGGDSLARDLARLGSEKLQAARTPGQIAEVEGLAKQAVDAAPGESRGASLLGLVRLRQGQSADGDALLGAASRLSRRDDDADRWAYFQALQARQFDEAFTHLDALLRRQQGIRKTMVRTVFPYLNDPKAVTALLGRLSQGPTWRGAFFEQLTRTSPDPAAAFPLLAALKDSPYPPTKSETSPMLAKLVAERRYEQAYLSWTLLMSPEDLARQGNIQDGGFDGWPIIPPFGWNFDSDKGGGGEITELGPGKGSALHVTYDGRNDQWLVRQLLVLPPGDYRLTGRYRTATNGVSEWRLICQGPPQAVAVLPVTSTQNQWRDFALNLTIPADGCSGQMLSLQGIPAKLEAPSEAWFDDIALVSRNAG